MMGKKLYQGRFRVESTRLKNWDYGSPGLYFVTINAIDCKPHFGQIVCVRPGVETVDAAMESHGAGVGVGSGLESGLESGLGLFVETQNFASLQTTPNQTTPNQTPHGDARQQTNPNGNPQRQTHHQPTHRQQTQTHRQTRPHPRISPDNVVLQPTPLGEIASKYWSEIPEHFPFVELDEFIVMPDHVHGILRFNKPGYRDWKKNSFGPQSQNLASVIRGYKVGVKTFATINGIPFAWQPRFYDHIIRTTHRLKVIRVYIRRNPIKWMLQTPKTIF